LSNNKASKSNKRQKYGKSKGKTHTLLMEAEAGTPGDGADVSSRGNFEMKSEMPSVSSKQSPTRFGHHGGLEF
jgi:hypothetical protein